MINEIVSLLIPHHGARTIINGLTLTHQCQNENRVQGTGALHTETTLDLKKYFNIPGNIKPLRESANYYLARS